VVVLRHPHRPQIESGGGYPVKHVSWRQPRR
jgi:hypothetical protein